MSLNAENIAVMVMEQAYHGDVDGYPTAESLQLDQVFVLLDKVLPELLRKAKNEKEFLDARTECRVELLKKFDKFKRENDAVPFEFRYGQELPAPEFRHMQALPVRYTPKEKTDNE